MPWCLTFASMCLSKARFLSLFLSALAVTGHAQTTGKSPAAEAPAAPQALASMENSLGMKFKAVPGTTVLFSAYETRVADFEAFLAVGTYKEWTAGLKPHFEQGPDHPAVLVNLQDAIAFCNWLTQKEQAAGLIKPNQSYRLPTSREWDAAAGMASTKQKSISTVSKVEETLSFIWGPKWPPPPGAGNFQSSEIPGYKDDYPFTAPVGKFSPTPEGLYDLAGNAWEWTMDMKLTATAEGTVRGGSWAYFRRECLTSGYTYKVPVNLRAPTIGFRCVFEDKKRTSEMLAAESAAELSAVKKRQEEMTSKSGVDKAAVDKLVKSATEQDEITALDPATLKPAATGQPFTQPQRLEFAPLAGTTVLFGRTEVPLGAWQAFTKAASYRGGAQPVFTSTPQHPVVGISWDDASAFCKWLTDQDHKNHLLPENARYRLPRDNEWSIAAGLLNESGGDPASNHLTNKTLYPWGDAWPPPSQSVNIDSSNVVPTYRDNYAKTAPVGAHTPNKEGIHDLGGNVSEWCDDPWPGQPGERVTRGGSWISSTKESLYSSARQHHPVNFTRFDLGFRIVVDLGN